ncbi:AraC-like ligand-binding domain-containing protein [Brenneria izbisi]|uniref:Helix-turn-helix domain-containing protein n=1 Tax=Brenneria izbisi TaxID=2939450 RepID=A0AA42C380_9GAMM|nr:helix-turn-helix domain-containing protein [Brenneria izbisi]MCV9878540.1 helix-turn-helix domain-containing protein [Brenneria izbisi]MCV9881963.1 helix-turn-helix domain-containing protein [Brenneria izbisi]
MPVAVDHRFDTDSVAMHERKDYWREVVCETFVPLHCEFLKHDAFSGRIQVQNLASISLVDVSASRQKVLRNKQEIARSREEFILLSMVLSGRSLVVQGGREALLTPGDFALYDTRSPYELHFDGAFRQMVVQIPRAELHRRVAGLEYLTALTLSANRPMEKLTFDFLHGLWSVHHSLGEAPQLHLKEQALDLLGMVLAERVPRSLPEKPTNMALLYRMKMAIQDRLSDPQLSLTVLASMFGISTRYASMLFESESTTFGRYLLHCRLERCARELRAPAQRQRKINEIAFHWGFSDISYFSRVFKQRFGMSAREFRLNHN